VGYDAWTLDGVSIRSLREIGGGAGAPREVELTLDRTPFYPEGGGQVGDTGWLLAPGDESGSRLRVLDTYREGDAIVHRAEVSHGSAGAGPYRAVVDAEKRAATQRNHTATHLLHAALRARLGTHLKQAGSLVAPDRLRFDFSHGKPLTPEDVHAIEGAVNERVLADFEVRTEVTSLREAQAKGAMALFGEKYGERVRQVIVDEYSRELCGGCHVRRTGEIGYFRVESEAAIAAGTRRIEAVTGTLAYAHAERDRALLRELASRLGAPREQIAARLATLQEETKRLQEERSRQGKDQLRTRVAELVRAAQGGEPPLVLALVEALGVEELREASDLVRQGLPRGGGLLAAVIDGKLSVAAAVGAEAVDRLPADAWVRDAVSVVGGKGGGKRELAVAGAKDASRVREVLDRGGAFAKERLEQPTGGNR
jgi:alanyl-tRNA synthetase